MSNSTEGKVIKCLAAVAWSVTEPISVQEIEVHPPGPGEVRIKIVSATVCHTDLHGLNFAPHFGDYFPVILGHEAAGIVESVGDGVTYCQVGDKVLPCFLPFCGECKCCKSGRTNWCLKKWIPWYQRMPSDGKSRFTINGKQIWHYMGTSTLSQYTVMQEIFVVKIHPEAPLDKVFSVGCGFSTGYGGAINAAKVHQGSVCAIWGLGTVGLAVVAGCKANGAKKIIGVDLNPEKEELGRKFGMTHFVNPKNYTKPIVEVIKELSDGGCDYTFECIGVPSLMKTALDCCQVGWGKCIILGVATGKTIEFPPGDLHPSRSVEGACLGRFKGRQDFPKLVKQYMDGKLPLDDFTTKEIELKDINVAFDQLRKGQGLRTHIKMF